MFEVTDRYREDYKYLVRKSDESEADFNKRSRQRQSDVKAEGKKRHALVTNEFFKPLGLEWEPVLKPTKQEKVRVYDCSKTAHTRTIQTDGETRVYPNKTSNSQMAQARNHDGYKLPNQLLLSDRFGFKLCHFVQAMQPSVLIKDKKSQFYLDRQRAHKEGNLKFNSDWASGCFTKDEFLFYRFWFFDLDFKSQGKDISFDHVKELLEHIGILKFLAVALETSPGNYHLYFHSQKIASSTHVSNWVKPLSAEEIQKITSDGYIDSIKGQSRLSKGWKKVARRGMVNPNSLLGDKHSLIGDDEAYKSFKQKWHAINDFLGGDNIVHDGTRVAQLPFFENPKNGFIVRIVYSNAEAPVMTLKDVTLGAVAEEPIEAIIEDKPLDESEPIPLPNPVEIIKEPNSQPSGRYRMPIPKDVKAYMANHSYDPQIQIPLSKKIYGKSNKALLGLTKYVCAYIDVTDADARQDYFDKIILPYLEVRTSKNLEQPNWRIYFRNRFESLCKTNLDKGYNDKKEEPPPKSEGTITRDQILKLLIKTVAQAAPDPKQQKKFSSLIERLTDALYMYELPMILDCGGLFYKFSVLSTFFSHKVSGYAPKLRKLEELGVLIRGSSYQPNKFCKEMTIEIPAEIVAEVFQPEIEEQKAPIVEVEEIIEPPKVPEVEDEVIIEVPELPEVAATLEVPEVAATLEVPEVAATPELPDKVELPQVKLPEALEVATALEVTASEVLKNLEKIEKTKKTLEEITLWITVLRDVKYVITTSLSNWHREKFELPYVYLYLVAHNARCAVQDTDEHFLEYLERTRHSKRLGVEVAMLLRTVEVDLSNTIFKFKMNTLTLEELERPPEPKVDWAPVVKDMMKERNGKDPLPPPPKKPPPEPKVDEDADDDETEGGFIPADATDDNGYISL